MFQKPEGASRSNTGLLVVHDNGSGSIDAVHGEDVLDHPHECFQRRRVRVDQADAPQIEVDRRRDVSGSVRLGRTQIEQ
jgi:hypothetical protein